MSFSHDGGGGVTHPVLDGGTLFSHDGGTPSSHGAGTNPHLEWVIPLQVWVGWGYPIPVLGYQT